MAVIKTVKMAFEYQPIIPNAPITPKQMYQNACSSDEITIESWRKQWVEQTKANKERFGSFKEHGIGKIFGKFHNQGCVIAGSGPSLANSIDPLKKAKGNVPLISCLHNFHYFTDNEITADFYVSLDAGEITIEEISEGGKKSHEEYLEATKNSTLLAFIGTHPKLLAAWKGKILFFNAPIPSVEVSKEIHEIENFNTYVSNGGNVLGACLYIAKAILGCSTIGFVGADFCFSYDNKFHAWDSKYDGKLGNYISLVDVFGHKVKTWQSYYNFKCWFDYIATQVPGLYVNCSEGGTFGAYNEGNIQHVIQMPLIRFLEGFTLYEQIRNQCENPETDQRILLF